MKTAIYGVNRATELLVSQLDDAELIFVTTAGCETFLKRPVISLDVFEKIDRSEICSIIKIKFFDVHKLRVFNCNDHLLTSVRSEDVLYVVYDLSYFPATFDAVTFAIHAEIERSKRNKKYIHLLVIPNQPEHETGIAINVMHDQHDIDWRVNNIVIPTFQLLKNTIGASKLSCRSEARFILNDQKAIFPDDWDVAGTKKLPRELELIKFRRDYGPLCFFEAPPQARKVVDQYLNNRAKGKKIVVITLREYTDQPKRNSRIEDWARFVKNLDLNLYHPVIVPDTNAIFSKSLSFFNGADVFEIAALNLHIRYALFERAFLAMGVSNGPVYLQNFLGSLNSVVFQHVIEEYPATTIEVIEKNGRKFGEHSPYRSHDKQITFWGVDTYENIKKCFNEVIYE
jgi:hypothetical protein